MRDIETHFVILFCLEIMRVIIEIKKENRE
jgi:hypothetical protein